MRSDRRVAVVLVAAWSLAFGPPLRAEYLKIGATSGSGMRNFNASNPITYNFAITTAGGTDGLTAINLDVWVDRGQQNNNDITVTIYDAFGGTGAVQATATIPYPQTASSTVQATGTFNPVVNLPAGGYSVQLTTLADGIGNNTYKYREGPLQLTDVNGVPLSSFLWVQDLNTTGVSTTSFSAATGVLAQHTLASQAVTFGNFRLGDTLSQTVQLTNSNIATANDFSEALVATATTTNTASVSGLPTAGTPLAQGQSTNLTVGLGSATAGPVSGDVNLSFTSEQGTSAAPGPFGTSVGSSTITVTGTGYREAAAGFSTTNASLGRFHIGATNVTGTIALDNTQTADQYSEGLAAAESATSGGASVVSGLPTVASPLAAGGQTTVTLALASVANVGTGNAGTVTLALDTSGNGTSGLAAASIGTQLINVSAQGYSGQSIWSRASGGVWDSFDNWDVPGGLPGVDGSLSVNDTATFGAGPTGATVVNLDGASPVLTELTFNSTAADYTLAPGSGGAFTLGTVQNAATVTSSSGSHTISAGIALARATEIAAANGSTLTLGGALSGSSTLTKSGPGELRITGTGGLSGPTTVAGGTLRVNGSIASSGVTVQSGATLAGSGTVGATTIEDGGTLSPGNSPGTISSDGTAVWQPGGDYNWQIYDAGGTAGTGWDLTSIAGDLDLTNLSALARFDINLWSLSAINTDVSGDAINFDPTQSFSWTIARVTGGGSILGFSADAFNLNLGAANGTDGFTNSLAGGTITIAQSGSDLNLVFTPVPVPEPAALTLLVAAAAGGWMLRRRHR